MAEEKNDDGKAKRENQSAGLSDETRELLRQAAANRARDGHGRFSSETSANAAAALKPQPSASSVPPATPPANSREEPKCADCKICPVALQMHDALIKHPDGLAPEAVIAPIREVCRNCSKPMCHSASSLCPSNAHDGDADAHRRVGRIEGIVQHINRLMPHPILKLLPFPFPALDHCDESTKTYIAFILERLASETDAAEKYRARSRHLAYAIVGIGVVALNVVCVWFALRFFGGGRAV